MKKLILGTLFTVVLIGHVSAESPEKQDFEAARKEYEASSHDESARVRYVTRLAQIREQLHHYWQREQSPEVEKALREADLRSMEEMWDGLPGGESFRAFHRRVVTGLEETLAAHGIRPMRNQHPHLWEVDDPGMRVIVVAHAGTNAVVLGRLLGLEPVPWEWDRFRQPHSGVSRLTMDRISEGWGFSLRQLGDVGHLERLGGDRRFRATDWPHEHNRQSEQGTARIDNA